MTEVEARIDGKDVRCPEGTTILEAAKGIEIQIPTLCHSPELRPSGNCRICVVEVEGAPRLVASCHTPIADGMAIQTQSRKVREVRRVIVELLLAGHTGPCVNDMEAKNCRLHTLAADLEIGPPRFPVRRPRDYTPEEASPYVWRDLSRCILCRRCIGACSEIAKKNVLSMAYRGFRSKVVVDFDEPLNKEVCKDCGICIDFCPTSALTKPEKGVA